MRPTISSLVIGAVVLAVAVTADAQTTSRTYRLGTLNFGPPPTTGNLDPRRDVVSLLCGMGYAEGQNLRVEQRYANGRAERLPQLANELVQLKVDVIVAFSSDAVRAAAGATKTIPIVMLNAGSDPVDMGLTTSLARTGGNQLPEANHRDGRARPHARDAPVPEHVEDGGLMGYGMSWRWALGRVALYVDRVLKGTKPADLPIEQAPTLTLAVNARTAKALGITIPQTVMLRAEQVLE